MNKLKKAFSALAATITMAFMSLSAAAEAASGSISGSSAVEGTTRLIADVQSALLVLAPVVGVVCVVYFCIRRSAADEMDQKKWNNRIITAVVSTIGAVVAVSLVGVLVSYYTT